MKFAVIGTSWITESYIDGAISTGLWELCAVYSRTYQKGLEFGEKYGTDLVYTDLEEFAKSNEFSAVYVASPNKFHYEQCKILLENGKHVICEKPITTYSWQLMELTALAKENKLIYMEAIMFMHQPTMPLLKEAIAKIGDVTLGSIDYSQRSSKYNAYLNGELPNIFNPKMETGALMDLGIYCLYPALYLFGEPNDYTVNMVKLDTGVDALGVINLIYSDKIISVRYSKISQSIANSELQSDKGTIYIESISTLNNIYIKYTDGTLEQITNAFEKTVLMGNESVSLYKFISDYENNKDFYLECQKTSITVNKYIEDFRKRANLPF
ncbi:MAG: Gfo/Idh/MocA family oxidoreductase [Clostridia bacterium]